MKKIIVMFLALIMLIPQIPVNSQVVKVTNYVWGEILGGGGKFQTEGPFSLKNTYSIRVVTVYENLKPGIHDHTVAYRTPGNYFLYQTNYQAFTVRRTSERSLIVIRNLAKYRYSPYVYEVPETITYIYDTLPVAGTWVQRIQGTWKAQIFLDTKWNTGGAVPIAETYFDIVQ